MPRVSRDVGKYFEKSSASTLKIRHSFDIYECKGKSQGYGELLFSSAGYKGWG